MEAGVCPGVWWRQGECQRLVGPVSERERNGDAAERYFSTAISLGREIITLTTAEPTAAIKTPAAALSPLRECPIKHFLNRTRDLSQKPRVLVHFLAKVDTTLNVYTQVLPDSLRAAVDRVGSELFSIVQFPEGASHLTH